MARSKKDCSVIMFDINTKNTEESKKCLIKICTKKFCGDVKDVTKLVFTNTEKTSNYLNLKNIYDVDKEQLQNYDPYRMCHLLEQSNQVSATKVDFLDAIRYGIYCLNNHFVDMNPIVTKQLIYITDLAFVTATNKDEILKRIIKELNDSGIYLYIIGLPVKFPTITNNLQSIKHAMKNLTFKYPNENFDIIKDILNKCENAIACDYISGAQLVFSFKDWAGGQPWQVALSFGTVLEIPAFTMKVLEKENSLRFKNPSGGYNADNVTWIDAENEDIEVDSEDIVNGISRHGKFVPMTKDTENMFKFGLSRSFNVLQFTEKKNVPEYYLRGEGSAVVVPNIKTPECNEALYVLIDTLEEKNLVAIARRVYNNNYRPTFVALIPKPNHNPKCFFLVELPYADDIMMNYEENSGKVKANVVKNETLPTVFNFLESIDIQSSGAGINVPLTPNLLYNMSSEKIINNTADKYLDKHLNLESLDVNLSGVEEPEGLKSIWPVREVKEEPENKDMEDDSDNEFQDDDI